MPDGIMLRLGKARDCHRYIRGAFFFRLRLQPLRLLYTLVSSSTEFRSSCCKTSSTQPSSTLVFPSNFSLILSEGNKLVSQFLTFYQLLFIAMWLQVFRMWLAAYVQNVYTYTFVECLQLPIYIQRITTSVKNVDSCRCVKRRQMQMYRMKVATDVYNMGIYVHVRCGQIHICKTRQIQMCRMKVARIFFSFYVRMRKYYKRRDIYFSYNHKK